MGRGKSPGEGWGEGGIGALHFAPAIRGLGPRYILPRPSLSGASTPEKGKRKSPEELFSWPPGNESPRSGGSRSSQESTPKTQRTFRKLSAGTSSRFAKYERADGSEAKSKFASKDLDRGRTPEITRNNRDTKS